MNHLFNTSGATLVALLLVVSLSGCGDTVDPPDGATVIQGLESNLSDDNARFTFRYDIMDPEGDDKRLRFEVCETADGADLVDCGAPIQGASGDGTSFVPTVPAGEFVEHVFRWDLGCGRFVGTERRSVEAETEYVGRVYVDTREAPASTSDPFEVPPDALNADTDCTPPE